MNTGVHFTNGHASQVAEIMIGDSSLGAEFEGVAPAANLFSASIEAADFHGTQSLNRMAQRTISPPLVDPDRVWAINMSYSANALFPAEDTDGNSLLTQFVDWSATEHDVSYVVAWTDQDSTFGPSAPSDNFNGITVAASTRELGIGAFDRFADSVNNPTDDFSGYDADGPRTSIDILAPGAFYDVIHPSNDMPVLALGASFAAPHVTGSIALLQQYASDQIVAGNPAFDFQDSRRHEVMKAVILNSADKLNGVHGSKRDILDQIGDNWTQMAASGNSTIPLDQSIGVGHLNVERAFEQYKGGESNPGAIQDVGWDFGKTGGIGDQLTYDFASAINGNNYIAVTLTWDRVVTPTFFGDYSLGDQFFDYSDIGDVLSDLNVYLVEVGSENVVAQSNSTGSSAEHIFFKTPSGGGDYKIVVKHEGSPFSESDGSSSSLDEETEFSLAWWSYEPTSILFGDYNRDGSIDQLDYDTWAASFGDSVFPGRDADGNLDGIINAADYTVWRDAFAAISLSVPEPSALVLLLAGAGVLGTRKST